MALLQKHNRPDTSHGTEAQLEMYALGQLPESELSLLEDHLLICEVCQERLDDAGDFAVGMREALATESKPAAARMPWLEWLRRPAFSMGLAFAALVIVVGIFSNRQIKLVPIASLQLTAMRGAAPSTGAARELDLTLTDSPRDGGPFRVEVVNTVGSTMWTTLTDATPGGVQVKVLQPLQPGDYFVRLYSGSGKLLREYGFRVRA